MRGIIYVSSLVLYNGWYMRLSRYWQGGCQVPK